MVECELFILFCFYKPNLVLIDTWWNVNTTEDIIVKEIGRFNRYMVECEFQSCMNCMS